MSISSKSEFQQRVRKRSMNENEGDGEGYASFILRLIEAVRERTLIYDKKHVSYFNRLEREKAWREVGELLGQSVDECQKRWKLLREKLFKELIKRDRIVASGEEFKSDWACYEQINFIEHHIAVRNNRKQDRFTPYFCSSPPANDYKSDNIDLAEELTKSITKAFNVGGASTSATPNKNRYNQHNLSLQQHMQNGASPIIQTSADTSRYADLKDEPTDLLEVEQTFSDSSDGDVGVEEKKQTALNSNTNEETEAQVARDQNPRIRVRRFDTPEETTENNNTNNNNNSSDALFGRLITSMLKDISSEFLKDETKIQIMQLLIQAKRNSNAKDTLSTN